MTMEIHHTTVDVRTSACGMLPVPLHIFPTGHHTSQHNPHLCGPIGIHDVSEPLDPVPADAGLRIPRGG